MKKFKAIARYQVADVLFSMMIFFIIFTICFSLGWLIITMMSSYGTPFKGMYLWMCAALGMCGGMSYSIDFKFALQNGVTRTQAFLSSSLSFGVVAVIFAFVDQLLLAVLPLCRDQSFVALYGEGYGVGFIGFGWTLLLNLAIVFVAYALIVLQNRVGLRPFLVGLLILGLLAFVLVPTLFQVVPSVADSVLEGLRIVIGVTPSGIQLAYPMVFFAGIALAGALASFLLLRRAEVR